MERFRSQIGGFFREWLLLPAKPGAPLVVFLTGTGGTAAWADRETGWSGLARREGFALALPEVLPPDPAVPPSSLTTRPRCNDGSPACDPPLPKNDERAPEPVTPIPSDDVTFLEAVIDDAVRRAGVDRRKVFLTGFSNGAGMTFRFAAEQADRLAAIAPVAGYCWSRDPKPSRPVPTLYTVGDSDLLLPLRGGEVRLPWTNRLVRRPPVNETLERWAAAIGCSPIPVRRSTGPAVRVDRYPGPVVFDAVTVEGLGHHWPGGRAQLNPRTAGPPSGAVNATEMIWEFFRSCL